MSLTLRSSLFVTIGTVLVLACGGERPVDMATPAGTREASPAKGAPAGAAGYELQFIDAMRQHHQGAVEMARMAVERSTDPKVKSLAQKMLADQQREIGQLQQWRDQWFPGAAAADASRLPGASSMKMDMTHMQSLSGHQFDMMWVDMMIPHHEGAVLMSCDAHEKSARPEIRNFARNVVRAQEQEISELEAWKAAMKM